MKLLITLILLCYTSLCCAETLIGTATHIYDGDTFILQADNRYHRIRLASIDAPELNQPYGLEAARLLRKLVYNKTVIAQVIDTDIYGRKVAKVYVSTKGTGDFGRKQPLSPVPMAELPVAELLLEQGAAWHYGRYDIYNEEYDLYQRLERRSRTNKVGLWAQDRPVPPWAWRKR